MTDHKGFSPRGEAAGVGEGFLCPIAGTAREVTRLSVTIVRLLRKLCDELDCCARCSRQADCRLLREYHCQVNAAIQAVNEEWNLTL
jgi:hypothetical protein